MSGFKHEAMLGLLALWLLGCGSAPARTGAVDPSAMRDEEVPFYQNNARDAYVMKLPVALHVERAWQLMAEVYDALQLGGGVVDSGKRIFGAQHLTYNGR